MRTQSLADVLRRSEHVALLMQQAVADLAAANTKLNRESTDAAPPPGWAAALEEGMALEIKLGSAALELTAVNRALEVEVRERLMVEHQLAAAVEQEAGARNAAYHDMLTGLPNRALFNDRLEHGIAQATRHQFILAVMMLDLDAFKSINDTYGHAAGDAVLKTIASRLTKNTRAEDTVARQSGDEFLYMFTQIREETDIANIALKILKAVRAPCHLKADAANVIRCIEASIGIAIFPKDGATADALIRRADAAMYRAKKKRSGYAFAQ